MVLEGVLTLRGNPSPTIEGVYVIIVTESLYRKQDKIVILGKRVPLTGGDSSSDRPSSSAKGGMVLTSLMIAVRHPSAMPQLLGTETKSR
jgi:hypothetical protein